MAFAARKEDGWRLCKRAGDTIKFVNQAAYPDVEILFPSQALAKACADELNERFWKSYNKHETKTPSEPNPLYWDMLDVIQKHKGLSDADYEKVSAA